MQEHPPIRVETVTRQITVEKPKLDDIVNDPENQAYFREIGRLFGPVLGWLVTRIVIARYRREIKRGLDSVIDGEIVEVPMVHIE